MYPVIVREWFAQSFSGLRDGAAFTGEGATGGVWSAVPAGRATVATVDGRKCVSLSADAGFGVIQFTATNALSGVERVDFAICAEPTPWFPTVEPADKGALVLVANEGGLQTFAGYTADGWVKLCAHGLARRSREWIDCRAEFEYAGGGKAHVTYSVRMGDGEYQALADATGVMRFAVNGAQRVTAVAFRGQGAVGEFTGTVTEKDASREHTWTGNSGIDKEWSTPGNWSTGRVPGDGDIANAAAGKSITFGKYTITAYSASAFSIVSNENLVIDSGDIKIACDDDDFTSLGTVIVGTGAKLRARGTYYGIDTRYLSTLSVDRDIALVVTGEPLYLDGVRLDLSATPQSKVEAFRLASGPYGSGGQPKTLSVNGSTLSGWSAAWHGRLDGSSWLWVANNSYETTASQRVAVWNDGAVGNLVDGANWGTYKPGAGRAAKMGNGQAHVNAWDSFDYSRYFGIGVLANAVGEVDMSGGNLRGGTTGSSVVVGASSGTGVLDVVGGAVTPYDRLWEYALTVGADTAATGSVRVRGGLVDIVEGSISIGAAGTASMELSEGEVDVAGSVAVGYQGTLDVSGGVLTGRDSFYIGRSTRTEKYDVSMTVSGGVVSNASAGAGAFWVGSYGGIGSHAALTMTDGRVVVADRLVCGGYRSAQVDVAGGTLVAPEICVGYDLVDPDDSAAFNVLSGRVETAGFTSGESGSRTISLGNGELVPTAANDDFFRGIPCVRLDGGIVVSNADEVVSKAAFMGPGGLVKRGAGTLKVAGYAAWAGRTVVESGVLDMDDGMVMGELVIADGASVVRAKYDDVDALHFTSNAWTSGRSTESPYFQLDSTLTASAGSRMLATDAGGVEKGGLAVVRAEDGNWTFSGLTALGWTDLRLADGTLPVDGSAHDVRMRFDFTGDKHYVFYYVRRGAAYERLVSADGLTAFPVAGETASVKNVTGTAAFRGWELYIDSRAVFYWIGPDVGDWADGDNWSHARNGAKADAYPGASHAAFIEKTAEIRLSDDSAVGTLVLNAAVTLDGGSLSVGGEVHGVGTLALAETTLAGVSDRTSIAVPLEVVARTRNVVRGTRVVVSGALRGSGALVAEAFFTGDTSAYAGSGELLGGGFAGSSATGHARAAWRLADGVYPFALDGVTYGFGSLNGAINAEPGDSAAITLEVGARDENCQLGGGWPMASDAGIVWTAGSAELSCAVTNVAHIVLAGGGRVTVCTGDGLPARISFVAAGGTLAQAGGVDADLSGLIRDSSAAIAFDDGGVNRTWATALDASNCGGFIKRGNGTLTLRSVPRYSGKTVVEAGVLVVPFGTQLGQVEIMDGASLKVDVAGCKDDGVVFAAGGSSQPLEEPYLALVNVPSGFAPNFISGEGNGLVVVNGSRNYVWTGASEDGGWSRPGNWWVDGRRPETPPHAYDAVFFESATCVTASMDIVSSVLALDGVGDLWLGGSYGLSTLLRFSVNGDLGLVPPPMSKTATSPDYYGATTNRLGVTVGGELDVRTIAGSGELRVTAGDLVVTPQEDQSSRFVSTLSAGNFIKRGAGTFDLTGDGDFTGSVAIEAGTLRLGTYRDLPGLRMDFDASDRDAMQTDPSGRIATWTSHDESYQFRFAAGQHAIVSTDYFGGRSALLLRPDKGESGSAFSRYELHPDNGTVGLSSTSLFLVYHVINAPDGGYLYSDSSDGNLALRIAGSGASHYWYNPKAGNDKGIFTGISHDTTLIADGNDYLTMWSDSNMKIKDTTESLGSYSMAQGLKGAVGEVVSFTRTLSHAEREVVAKQLMHKWGLGYPDYCAIHSDTPVTMKSGAKLDLGGQDLTVARFTGAGVVTNGILRTVDGVITQEGGNLTVPAVEGANYIASRAGEKLVITGAAGVGVTITLPRSWFAAGASGRRAVFCESKDITWRIGRRDASKPVDEGDGWWTIPGGGFAVRLK